jgi:hypothetical protein
LVGNHHLLRRFACSRPLCALPCQRPRSL